MNMTHPHGHPPTITSTERIKSKALEILKTNPEGLRYSELVRLIHKELPEIPINTIHGIIWNLETRMPEQIYKPGRGSYRYVTFRDAENKDNNTVIIPLEVEKIKEERFYQPFADWLCNELEECTKAVSLGGNKFKDKWGTPDVIGKREPTRSDIIKATTEIVSAEIKIDSRDLITAFGQACSYKLFSHKCYIVIPKTSSSDDVSKLDALCLVFGLGLVLFDSNNPIDPHFEIRVRSLKHEPDMFYVNKYIKLVEKQLFD